MLLYVFVSALLLVTLWIALHLRPLKDGEVDSLAEKRRSKAITKYFAYQRHEVPVNETFKKRMDPKGRMYESDETLASFPALAASLLKYKKHEWVILAFEVQQAVRQFWTNKGSDGSSVSILLGIDEVARLCHQHGASSVLFFHNHPNPDPARYSTATASQVDAEISRGWAESLAGQGASLLSFVCERGTAHEYFRAVPKELLPVARFAERINEANGLGRLSNLCLHLGRLL